MPAGCGRPPDSRRRNRLDPAGEDHPHKGEAQPFEPFDRFAHGAALRRLVAPAAAGSIAELRAEGVATVGQWHLTREQLALRGRHPELGQVTLSQLLASWVVHDLGHIAQISRVMAKQYTAAVGPWQAYLPVLTR